MSSWKELLEVRERREWIESLERAWVDVKFGIQVFLGFLAVMMVVFAFGSMWVHWDEILHVLEVGQ